MNDYINEIEDAKVYLDWYITILTLNHQIDETKVSKHPIYFNNTVEFREATINTSKMEKEPRIQHWKRVMNYEQHNK